jgi:hypothetical protein
VTVNDRMPQGYSYELTAPVCGMGASFAFSATVRAIDCPGGRVQAVRTCSGNVTGL